MDDDPKLQLVQLQKINQLIENYQLMIGVMHAFKQDTGPFDLDALVAMHKMMGQSIIHTTAGDQLSTLVQGIVINQNLQRDQTNEISVNIKIDDVMEIKRLLLLIRDAYIKVVKPKLSQGQNGGKK